MKKSKVLKKATVLLLALAMVLSALPFSMITSFAAGPGVSASSADSVFTVPLGYTSVPAKQIVVNNGSSGDASIAKPESTEHFDVYGIPEGGKVLAAGEDVTIAVVPKTNFGVGDYTDTIAIDSQLADGTNDTDTVSFTLSVKAPLTLTLPSKVNCVDGVATTLTVNATGGSGNYAYAWTSDDASETIATPTSDSISVTPKDGTRYTVTVKDQVTMETNKKSCVAKVVAKAQSISVSGVDADGNLDFGKLEKGYTPTEKTVTVLNNGNAPVTLKTLSPEKFDVTDFKPDALAVGNSFSFKVKPKAGLTEGTYDEVVKLVTMEGLELGQINMKLNVIGDMTINIIGPTQIFKGESVTLVASVLNGSGSYTYGWYKGLDIGPKLNPISNTDTVTETLTGKRTYAVFVRDTVTGREAEKKIVVMAVDKVNSIDVTPISVDFGQHEKGEAVAAQAVTVENNGTTPITLGTPTVKNYVITDFTVGELAPGETMTFNIKPKANLKVGTYDASFDIPTVETLATTANPKVNLVYGVHDKLTAELQADPAEVAAGGTTKLTAVAAGGTGDYSYAWFKNGKALTTIPNTRSSVNTSAINKDTTYSVVVTDKVTSKSAEAEVVIKVVPDAYSLETDVEAIEFGAIGEGYTVAPEAKSVTVKNTGNKSVTLSSAPDLIYYTITPDYAGVLNPGETRTFEVQPKLALTKNKYPAIISISDTEGKVAVQPEVNIDFEVTEKLSVKIIPTAVQTIVKGESVTLTAEAKGGTGSYTYKWYEGKDTTTTPISETNTVTAKPEKTNVFTVVASDESGVEARSVRTVKVEDNVYSATVDPTALSFEFNSGATEVKIETVKLTNTGNTELTFDGTPILKNFLVRGFPTTVAPGKTVKFRVLPKKSLKVGTYTETLEILPKETLATPVSVALNAKVNEALTASINPETADCICGQNIKMKVTAEGGTGAYTYKWYANDVERPTWVTDSKNPKVKEDTVFKVIVSDGIEEKEVTCTVTVVDGLAVDVTDNKVEFATKNEGYAASETRSVVLTNLGSNPVELIKSDLTNFDIENFDTTNPLAGNGTMTFNVSPKLGLAAGEYKEVLEIKTNNGAKSGVVNVELSFTVDKELKVAVKPAEKTVIDGYSDTIKLEAEVTGGSGTYTYEWYAGKNPTVLATGDSVSIKPTETTEYRVVVSDGRESKEAKSKVIVLPKDYTITAKPVELAFAKAVEGYKTAPAAQTVTIKNDGNQSVEIDASKLEKFDVVDFPTGALAVGKSATFKVQPKTGLGVGTYSEELTVSTKNGTTAKVKLSFEVIKGITAKVSPETIQIVKGTSCKLTADVTGGSGKYSYQWYTGEGTAKTLISGSTGKEITVSPESDTTYTLVVVDTDTLEEKAVTAKVTVRLPIPIIIPTPITPTPTPVTPTPEDKEPTAEEKLIAGVEGTYIKLKSTAANGGIALSWTKSEGYSVDCFEVYRSTQQFSGFGTKPIYTTKSGLTRAYVNTKGLESGVRYFYKIRGVREINGKKYYTNWSNKAFRYFYK